MGIKHIVKKQGGFRVSFSPLDDESDHKKFISLLESTACKGNEAKRAYTVNKHGKNIIDVDVHCGHVTESDIYTLYEDSESRYSKYDLHLAKIGAAAVAAGAAGNVVGGKLLDHFSPQEHPKIMKAIETAKSKSQNFFSRSK